MHEAEPLVNRLNMIAFKVRGRIVKMKNWRAVSRRKITMLKAMMTRYPADARLLDQKGVPRGTANA
jgi:hypothetical protein